MNPPSAGHPRLILPLLLTDLGHACAGGAHPGLGWMEGGPGTDHDRLAGPGGPGGPGGWGPPPPCASGDLQGDFRDKHGYSAPGNTADGLLEVCAAAIAVGIMLWTMCLLLCLASTDGSYVGYHNSPGTYE